MTFDIPRARALLSPCRGRRAIDVGARGDTAVFLADRFDEVWAFEPDPEAYADLLKLPRSNIHAFPEALGWDNPLDARSPDPDLIKIDTGEGEGTGHELEVLDGAENTIGRRMPTLYIEYHSEGDRQRIKARLCPLGYEVLEVRRLYYHGWLFAQRSIPLVRRLGYEFRERIARL